MNAARFPYWHLLWEMTRTEMKLRDQGTLLGFFWTLLHPVLMFVVLYTLFIKWMGRFVDQYGAYLLVGIVLWNFFHKATSVAQSSLKRNAGVIMNFRFPREIIVLASVGAVFWSALLELCVLLPCLPLLGVWPTWTWLTLPVFLALELALALGVSLLLALATVEYQDMERIWEVLSMAMFYLTPVFYPVSIIAEHRQPFLLLNPVTQILEGVRGCLIGGELPGGFELLYVAAVSGSAAWIGLRVLRRFEHRLADRLVL